jgi:hypothetical protein
MQATKNEKNGRNAFWTTEALFADPKKREQTKNHHTTL